MPYRRTPSTSVNGAYVPINATVTASSGPALSVTESTDSNSKVGVYLADNAANYGRLLDFDHYGQGNGTGLDQAWAMNIRNWPGAGAALVIHQYSSQYVAAMLDNTGHQPLLRLRATENQGNNPNSKGSHPYIDFQSYAMAQFTDGVVNGTTTFTSATANFTSADIGAAIQSAQLLDNTYIASVTNSTTVVLSQAATASTGGVTFVLQRGSIQSNLQITPFNRIVGSNALIPLTVSVYGDGVSRTALQIDQPSNGDSLVINTKGSGNAITFKSFSSTKLSILASGQVKTSSGNEATGSGSAALGANSPAVTNTAPYTWLKFTSSDGSQVYVPAWK